MSTAQAAKAPLMGRFLFQDRVVFAVIALLFVWSVSEPLHVLPWISWHNEILSYVAVFVAGWYGLRKLKMRRSDFAAVPYAVMPFAAILLLAIAQGAAGLIVFWGDVVVLGLYVSLCCLALVLGYNSAGNADVELTGSQNENRNAALSVLAFTLLIAAAISAIAGLVQVLDVWDTFAWVVRMPQLRRPGANLAQPNQLSTLLLMGLASLVYLYEARKLKTAVAAIILFILLLSIATTESRTGIVSFFGLLLWWFFKRRHIVFRLGAKSVALSTGLFCALFSVWPSMFSAILGGLGVQAQVNISAGLRLVVWPQLLQAVLQRPWFGWGLNQVPKAHNAVVSAYPVSEPYSYSHNIVIDLLLGAGIPIAFVVLVCIALWTWRVLRNVDGLKAWYCFAVVLPVAIHSLLEYPFTYAYFLAPVMFALGMLEKLSHRTSGLRLKSSHAIALLLLSSTLAVWSVVDYIAIEEDFRVARFEAMRVGKTPASYKTPEILLLTQLDALLKGARISPAPGMSAEDLELTRNVALRFPWPATLSRYALSLALNGQTDEALRQLEAMKSMYSPKIYSGIKENWQGLSGSNYPELLKIQLP